MLLLSGAPYAAKFYRTDDGTDPCKNKKVLYLNFEPYSGFEYIMQKKFVYDMMDILYFLQEDAEKFRCRLESMVEMTGNLYYLPPVFSYPDMEEIDEKHGRHFAEDHPGNRL